MPLHSVAATVATVIGMLDLGTSSKGHIDTSIHGHMGTSISTGMGLILKLLLVVLVDVLDGVSWDRH